jgi:hypothetical protein
MRPMSDPTHDLQQRLAALVVKERVGLGGLVPSQRALALGLVWAGLPDAAVSTEPEINLQLKAQLAGPAVWLATDHVELRRWLVDAGWLQRDGFGRAYRRTARADLRPDQAPVADALAGLDTFAWVAQQRAAHVAAREAGRRAWAAGQGGHAGKGSAP